MNLIIAFWYSPLTCFAFLIWLFAFLDLICLFDAMPCDLLINFCEQHNLQPMADSQYFYAVLHKHSFISYDYCVETDFYELINLDLNWTKGFLVLILSCWWEKKRTEKGRYGLWLDVTAVLPTDALHSRHGNTSSSALSSFCGKKCSLLELNQTFTAEGWRRGGREVGLL